MSCTSSISNKCLFRMSMIGCACVCRFVEGMRASGRDTYITAIFFFFLFLSNTEYEPDCNLECVDQVFAYMCVIRTGRLAHSETHQFDTQ